LQEFALIFFCPLNLNSSMKLIPSLLLGTLALTATASAATLAHWRFEDSTAGTQAPSGTGGFVYDQNTFLDSSGNGNHLEVWDQGGAGYAYRAVVPYSTIPQTNAANTLSIKNTGGGPATFTNPSSSMSTMALSQWTVEVSWKPENGGFRTVVGRDGRNMVSGNGALSALYVGATPDNRLKVEFVDEDGRSYQAVSAANYVSGFNFGTDPDGLTGTWYNIAAVSDGSSLMLYNNGVLLATTTLSLTGNTALTNGTTTVGGDAGAGDWTAGTWTVGRGLYNGGHVDRAYGYIDEVRISDTALPQNLLLASIPEPSALVVLLGALVIPFHARRRK
jgi:hypothetical protein